MVVPPFGMIVRPVSCSDVVDLFSYFHGPFFLHAPSGPLFLVDSFPSGRYFLGRFFSNCGRFSVDLFSVDLFSEHPTMYS